MKNRNSITRVRGRYLREVAKAQANDRKCYLALKITNGPNHESIHEDWCDQKMDMRTSMVVNFGVEGIGDLFMRSERHGCIEEDLAVLSTYKDIWHQPAGIPPYVSVSESHLWQFIGGIVFPGEMIPEPGRVSFCEYNAETKKGIILVTFDGGRVSQLQQKFPQLSQDIRAFKVGEYNWLCSKW